LMREDAHNSPTIFPAARRRFFAPEVVQTSAMDCGPATLKSLLEGFGLPVDYGRLREACQTDVDGTSINTVEDIARQLGLVVRQVMTPVDHLLLPEANLLPALVVTLQPTGMTHFVVVWRVVGPLVQVMDPAGGRRWLTRRQFSQEIYTHQLPVAGAVWRAWAGTAGFCDPLRARLRALGVSPTQAQSLLDDARGDPGWRGLAALDAATRLTDSLVAARGVGRGAQAGELLSTLYRQSVAPEARADAQTLPQAQPSSTPPSSGSNSEGSVSADGPDYGDAVTDWPLIPSNFWSVEPRLPMGGGPGSKAARQDSAAVPDSRGVGSPADAPEMIMRGAVALTVSERRAQRAPAPPRQPSPTESGPRESGPRESGPREQGAQEQAQANPARPEGARRQAQGGGATGGAGSLPPDLAASLDKQPRAAAQFLAALRQDGLMAPLALVGVVLLAGFGVILEALLLRGLLEAGIWLANPAQGVTIALGITFFTLALLILELPRTELQQRLGRRVENRLRIALLTKIPRLGDRYFHSRLLSDMAHRAYALRQLYAMPSVLHSLLYEGSQLLFTAAGILWIAPQSAPGVAVAVAGVVAGALLSRPMLRESELRVRTHDHALSRFYLDALLGLMPIRAHSAQRSVRREQEMLVVAWGRAMRNLSDLQLTVQAVTALLGLGSAAWIVIAYLARGGVDGGGEISGVPLLLYWSLNLPTLAQSLMTTVQRIQPITNQMERLLEPLTAPEESRQQGLEDGEGEGGEGEGGGPENRGQARAEAAFRSPPAITLRRVSVVAAGRAILTDISLALAAGEHVAIVGASGAGKSTLVGLLLGWQRPAGGELLVDGAPLRGARLHALRRATAWVDPGVQIWNRSLAANLRYGLSPQTQTPLDNARGPGSSGPGSNGLGLNEVLGQADLHQVLRSLPQGWATPLGEGGGFVSGGEGQRVRFGRALLRPEVRLAILDEPFRGLDRGQRRQLLNNARRHWQAATLLCITHDVTETQGFDRVIVLADGCVVEDGSPQALLADPHSHYATLARRDGDTQRQLWGRHWAGESGDSPPPDDQWRRLYCAEGDVREGDVREVE
jgi:ATP-binding cassette subfamily B protein